MFLNCALGILLHPNTISNGANDGKKGNMETKAFHVKNKMPKPAS